MTKEERTKVITEFNEILKTEDIDSFVYYLSTKIPEVYYSGYISDIVRKPTTIFLKEIIDNPALIKVKTELIYGKYTDPVWDACYSNNIPNLDLLLKISELNINKKRDGEAPLYTACESNNIEIVKLLLDHPDIDVNVKNKYGNTTLYLACYKNYIEIVKLLLEQPNIDVNVKNGNENTALDISIYRYSIDILKLILSNPNTIINTKEDSAFWNSCVVISNQESVSYYHDQKFLKVLELVVNSSKTLLDFDYNYKKNEVYLFSPQVRNLLKKNKRKYNSIDKILDTIEN